MNTFSVLALGWILYLAVNGKLVEFISLATANPVAPPHTGKRSGLLPTKPLQSVKPVS